MVAEPPREMEIKIRKAIKKDKNRIYRIYRMYRNCDAQDLDESTGPPEHLQFFKIHTLTTDEKEPFLGF